jgi:hypothetical protein
MGTFRAFEIILPAGKVARTYDQLAAKKLFGDDMGTELMNADDSCVQQPGSCFSPGLAGRTPARVPR